MDIIQFHIEGDSALRKGFNKLISQKLAQRSFNINMNKDRENTIKQYKRDTAVRKFLIIDLENHPSERETELAKLSLGSDAGGTCFMVQKMEAWFIAQAEQLFDAEIAEKLGKGNPEHVDKPDAKISEVLYKIRGKRYDKKADGIKFLQKLNLSELEKKFKDVENLVTNFTN